MSDGCYRSDWDTKEPSTPGERIAELERENTRIKQERRWLLHDMHRIMALTTDTAPHGGIAEYDDWSSDHLRLNRCVRDIATTSIKQNSDGKDPL